MINPIDILNLNSVGIITFILKMFFIGSCTYYVSLKLINSKNIFNKKLFFIIPSIFITSVLAGILRYVCNYFICLVFLSLIISIIFSVITKNKFGNSILTVTLSLSINYVIYIFTIIISFIFASLFHIKNDYISLFFMAIIHCIILYFLFHKLKRFKNGFAFIQRNINNEYFDILILNTSVVVLFSFILISNFNLQMFYSFFFALVIFAIIMFITIQKSLTLYYKHKLLVQDLEETKAELSRAKNELDELEKENLNFSKTSHSIAHKQKSLEYKLNKLLLQNEMANELTNLNVRNATPSTLLEISSTKTNINNSPLDLNLKNEVQKLSEQCFSNKNIIELPKTNITEIDDMLAFTQSECIKNNIEFELILSGNIYHIINNLISKEELEILIADLTKNAIISIQNSENINRSILLKLGLFSKYYSLCVYDSGIEFKLETFKSLGKKPCSTHLDSGGTGIGFMNIFDTLNKYKSSLLIKEIGEPSKDNYTKLIEITFDKQNMFKIYSYRADKISFRKDFVIKPL